MLSLVLIWCLLGFLGWCVFTVQLVIEDGLTTTIREGIAEGWFTVGFFAACIVFGLLSLLLSIFFTRLLPGS